MNEQEANDQNKSPEDYKLPEAYDLLGEQVEDSDWLEADNNSLDMIQKEE